ncbi:NDMA-dependent alcohol dehydrogenase [Gordonia sp. TBRC 11910]|uniref:alcohol dehydrogenase n=1 Tax=Gordonia asplenii TaxID=2725283 RepID=A0A848KXU4_9ACTN|nr:NDMA-dependent alcohol dehydrogenase [Gordonia asplenii]NMO02937.1 NDMA-dependent alcohol dehydrogenase [Gordonia asplenii]
MKARAAILWERNTEWSVEDIDLDDPKDHEVLVKVVASGLCHSDDHAVTGDLPISIPIIGGHEGAGVVEAVGPGVVGVAPGDHVVMSFIPSCGKCRWCATGHSNLCDLGAHMLGGTQLDGTARAHARGTDVGSLAMLGTFANYTVVPENSVIKIDSDIPLDRACLVGCGVTTGWGSAVNTGEIEPGDTVVVVGIGGIGGSAVQGARMAGARNIVAVDLEPSKEELAKRIGATHFVGSVDEVNTLVGELTLGVMADVAILTVGVVDGDMLQPMVGLARKAGKVVVTGVAPATQIDAKVSLFEVTMWQKQIRGSLFGEANPRSDIPRLLALYKSGQLLLDEMVTREYPLDQINDGYADMKSGRNLRGVIIHEH